MRVMERPVMVMMSAFNSDEPVVTEPPMPPEAPAPPAPPEEELPPEAEALPPCAPSPPAIPDELLPPVAASKETPLSNIALFAFTTEIVLSPPM